jgi:hypothetical protein
LFTANVEATVAFIDILILFGIGVPIAIIWIALVRASARGGCGTAACRLGRREADENEREPNAG